MTADVLPSKRQPAGRHLVEHHAEREQVGARVERPRRAPAPATCRRPCRRPCPGWSACSSASVGGGGRRRPARRPCSAGAASPGRSRESSPARASVTKMFAGLMSRWTMPCRVRGVQRVGNLDRRRRAAGPTRAGPCRRCACFSVFPQQLHRDERAGLRARRPRRWCRCCGWFSAEAARASRWKRSSAWDRLASSSGRNFSATRRPAWCPRPCRRRPCRRRRAFEDAVVRDRLADHGRQVRRRVTAEGQSAPSIGQLREGGPRRASEFDIA